MVTISLYNAFSNFVVNLEENYFRGALGNLCSNCSGNVQTIATEAKCRLIVSKLENVDAFGGVLAQLNNPKGCYEYEGKLYWNNHTPGKTNYTMTPICKSTIESACGN